MNAEVMNAAVAMAGIVLRGQRMSTLKAIVCAIAGAFPRRMIVLVLKRRELAQNPTA
ncbi:hypothetical protein ACLMJV_29395 [Sinorhizobium meliloti]|uniref:hypothetical protein n=1 Tax=Rhizobium meliloti TaxID=382 RepID=UPI00398C9BD3